jgi:crotonobetainyl-CoA:carnitine CoA-transferase CaiB-like acyl-CoA transferase
LRTFEQEEAALGPVYDVADIFQDPHFRARQNIVEVPDEDLGKITMQGVFPKLSATPGLVRWTGPRLGQHNQEIYVERLGLDPEDLEQLHERGVV